MPLWHAVANILTENKCFQQSWFQLCGWIWASYANCASTLYDYYAQNSIKYFFLQSNFFLLEFHFKSTNHTRTYNIDVDHTSRRLATLQIKSNRHSSRYVVLRYWSPKYFKNVFLSHSPKLDTLYLESHVHSNFRFLADILPTLYSLFSKHDRYPPD